MSPRPRPRPSYAGSTPEGAEAELREAVSLARADDKLAELRAELGLDAVTDTSGELPA